MLRNGELLDRFVVTNVDVVLWKDEICGVGASRELLARFAVADTLHVRQ